jgi:hypothetical protein
VLSIKKKHKNLHETREKHFLHVSTPYRHFVMTGRTFRIILNKITRSDIVNAGTHYKETMNNRQHVLLDVSARRHIVKFSLELLFPFSQLPLELFVGDDFRLQNTHERLHHDVEEVTLSLGEHCTTVEKR